MVNDNDSLITLDNPLVSKDGKSVVITNSLSMDLWEPVVQIAFQKWLDHFLNIDCLIDHNDFKKDRVTIILRFNYKINAIVVNQCCDALLKIMLNRANKRKIKK